MRYLVNNFFTVVLIGQDGTEAFEDVGHSSDARAMQMDYYIGDLHPVSCFPKVKKLHWSEEGSFFKIPIVMIFCF